MTKLESIFRGKMALCTQCVLCVLLCVASVGSALNYDVTEEVLPAGSYVGNIPEDADLASVYSASELPLLRYNFFSSDDDGSSSLFSIEETTGVLRTSQHIDREFECGQQDECVISLSVAITPADNLRIIDVTITIIDFNDHLPMFDSSVITLEISEQEAVGYKLPLPQAQDGDSSIFSISHYELASESDHFELESLVLPNGLLNLNLVLTATLDHELVSSYNLRIIAYDGGDPASTGFMDIDILVQDSNDNIPAFENSTYSVSIPEDTPVNTTIITVVAHDADQGEFGEIIYDFGSASSEERQLFGIDSQSGAVYVKSMLNYETQASYTLVLSATNTDPGAEVVFTTVFVTISDVNDNPPHITLNVVPPAVTPQINESDVVGKFVALISVMDPDSNENGEFFCSIVSDSFSLQEFSQGQYKVLSSRTFNHEVEASVDFEIYCSDLAMEPLTSMKRVTVAILDLNDNPPVFTQDMYSVEIAENNNVNHFIVQVNATDADSGANSALSYWLDGDMANLFEIDAFTGVIQTRIMFDFETMREFMFRVITQDGGNPALYATSTVLVTVLDRNDEPPHFSSGNYTFHVLENQPVGMEIGIVSATDRDTAPNDYFEYSILGSPAYQQFAVDTTTGHVRTRATLDREAQASYELIVIATNVRADLKLSGTAVIHIKVDDANDNAPIIDFPNGRNSTLQVSSRTPEGAEVGFMHAHDNDDSENAVFSFSIISGNINNAFNIHHTTGLLTTAKNLWDTDLNIFDLTIRVTDQGFPPLASEATLSIIVNQTLGYYGPGGSQALIGGSNLQIVIALVVTSVIIIIILVIAILTIIYKNRKRAKEMQYRYRAEGIQVWNENNSTNKADKDNVVDHSIDGTLLLKEGGFNSSHDTTPPSSDGHVALRRMYGEQLGQSESASYLQMPRRLRRRGISRCLLAALHFNENSGRLQQVSDDGSLRWYASYPKHRGGDGVLKKVKAPCTYGYVHELLEVATSLRDTYPSYRKAEVLGIEQPPILTQTMDIVEKDDLIARHMSRFIE